MMDGLALGETTPSPLIIVVAFVCFVGDWTKAVFGPDALIVAGASIALFGFKIGVIPLLAVCAALGLAIGLLRSQFPKLALGERRFDATQAVRQLSAYFTDALPCVA